MSEQGSKSRFAIDLDDLERQLRSTASSPVQGKPVSDPLADLARIVGKDDPFKAMFDGPRPGEKPSQAPRMQAPSLVEAARHAPAGDAGLRAESNAALDARLRGALDEFDEVLRSDARPVSQGEGAASHHDTNHVLRTPDGFEERIDHWADEQLKAGPDHVHPDDHPRGDMVSAELDQIVEEQRNASDMSASPAEGDPDMVPLTPRSSKRKAGIVMGGLMALAVVGISFAVSFKPGGPKAPAGEPPTIKADSSPIKVAPVNPGGTVIPDQNKQIYEKNNDSKPTDTKVVNREEQPVDVQAAARAVRQVLPGAVGAGSTSTPSSAPAGTSLPGATGAVPNAAAAPPVSAALTDASPAAPLGEPRKVRTVSIRPDGSVVGSGAAASAPTAAAAAARPAGPPVLTLPTTPAVAPPRVAAAVPKPEAKPEAKPVQDRVAAATPAAAPPRAAPVAAAPRPATPETPVAAGSFSVQLGAPGSEAEARSSFASLQRRFPSQLSDQSPLIRRAELGDGRTVYRLRVGPMSREDAAELCQGLQGAGGQCFVARN
jgi:SPOR domain